MKLPLPVDKSFLQGTKASRLLELQEKYYFLIPDAFYYELLNNDHGERKKVINGIKAFSRVHLGKYLSGERTSGLPADIKYADNLQFTDIILDPKWKANTKESAAMVAYREKHVEPLIDFFNEAYNQSMVDLSHSLHQKTSAQPEEFKNLVECLREQPIIIEIAQSLNFPHKSSLSDCWLHFRLYQVMTLQVMVLKRLYSGGNQIFGRDIMRREVHDLDYLLLGLYFGRLATREAKTNSNFLSMAWKFQVLSPEGHLISE